MHRLLLIWMALAFLWLPSPGAAGDVAVSNKPQDVVAAIDKDASKYSIQNPVLDDARLDSPPVSDPLEPWNRFVYAINDIFYHGLLKPIAMLYAAILPEPVRVAVGNFFHNLAMPKHFVSALLQGKVDVAGQELSRFLINTTLGGLGFFDVAETHFNLKSSDEDIGQALGNIGMGDAIYIEWPLIGPSTLRDSIGMAGDVLLNPLTYYPENQWTRLEIYGLKMVNHNSLHLGEYEDLQKAAIDPYIALRDAFLQMRRDQIKR
ncbi:MAG: VacJ family lipoprotein [Magnetococcales bacterium]|nr:VacJ family lipoprotein [Magnetococcales bacterium]